MKARLMMGAAWRVAMVAACGVALSACSQKGAAEAPPLPGDQVVARVDGAAVWASDVKREAAAQGLIGRDDPLQTSSVMFHQVLDEVIDQKLLAAEAVRRGLDKDAAARRRLEAARERALDDILLEASTDKASPEAINGLYQQMLKTHPALSFQDAKPQIIRFLTYDRVKDLILTLRRGAKVESLIAPLPPPPPAAPTPAPDKAPS